MKAISFLGPTRYTPTIYCYNGNEKETPFFTEALVHFFPDLEQILVLLTPTVRNPPPDKPDNWAEVQRRLGDLVKPLPIPEGHSEAELWDIFNALTASVDEGDTVVFDITYSFRSLPFLTFLAAAYLRTARQIKVHKIIYGAFEAKDAANRTPVFDLTPFVGLLDWLTATNQFIYTGDGRYLARLLERSDLFEHPRRKLTPAEREAEATSKRIHNAADSIEETTAAMLTSLIPHAERASANLIARLECAALDLAAIAPPYRVLAERVRTSYIPFAQPDPMTQDIAADLEVQLALARWYLDKGHIPQAGTLMREWLVSAVAYRLGITGAALLDAKGLRGEVEKSLGWFVQQRGGGTHDELPVWVAQLNTWPEREQLINTWNELADWRNLINHGAIRKNWREISVKSVLEKGEKFYAALLDLAATWGLSAS